MITIDARAPAYVELAFGFECARKLNEQQNDPGEAPHLNGSGAPQRPTLLGGIVSQIVGLFRRGHGPGANEMTQGQSLSVLQTWWRCLKVDNQARVGSGVDRTAGSIGEQQLLNILESRLSDEYIAVGGALLLRNLDIDVIVVGPTGIWVLESKYWAGDVKVSNGTWTHESGTATVPRNLGLGQTLAAFTPDMQWKREQEVVIKTLGGAKLMILNGWPVKAVKGGIAFTHPNARLNIDDSCQALWGSSKFWADKIHNAPKEPSFSTKLQLRTVDALLESSLRLYTPSVKPKSAATLANSLDQG
jgi:hypothetical protein